MPEGGSDVLIPVFLQNWLRNSEISTKSVLLNYVKRKEHIFGIFDCTLPEMQLLAKKASPSCTMSIVNSVLFLCVTVTFPNLSYRFWIRSAEISATSQMMQKQMGPYVYIKLAFDCCNFDRNAMINDNFPTRYSLSALIQLKKHHVTKD